MHLTPTDMESFFNPKSIALVGVSRSGWRFGGLSFLRRLIDSNYEGRLYPINAKADEILGVKAWPDLDALPEVPDLVMIAVGAAKVPDLITACAEKGVRHVHLLTAGFDELGTAEGQALADRLVSACKHHDVLLIGPNCMGPYRPAARLTAWGAIPGLSGPLGIISQSGGMTQRLTEYAASLGVGVEKAVSVGNSTVLDSLDFLEAFGDDPLIKVVGIYLEDISDGERFLGLARAIGQRKPIVVLKGGQTEAGARIAASHTGALAGSAAVWEGISAQTNLVGVTTMDEWMDALMAFAFLGEPSSDGTFVISGGGGTGVVFADRFLSAGLGLPRLSRDGMSQLAEIVPAAGSIAGNPLDFWQVFTDTACLGRIVAMAERESQIGIIVVDRLIGRLAFHMPDMPDTTREIVDLLDQRINGKPVAFVVDSEGGDADLAAKGAAMRAAFGHAGYAAFPTAARAARTLARVCRYHERRARLSAFKGE